MRKIVKKSMALQLLQGMERAMPALLSLSRTLHVVTACKAAVLKGQFLKLLTEAGKCGNLTIVCPWGLI
jgi:DNA replicative helicase MCM subunit Mcm2 (Cdc46/Mcm family)